MSASLAHAIAILYPPGVTREVQWALGAVVRAISSGVYILVWRRCRGR